ncbi:hypothetical protein QN277_029356 [Acacia crassicarpa]|uniref:Uncharacterized protein n=1 Tax=Acacia crassicarpa TaxID=499986 RepID=A0AAE1J9E2_9FABA|nr:hypothetical protein QN277_029356 [Acacia crassicarpa]
MVALMMKVACMVVLCVALVAAPMAEAVIRGQVTGSVDPSLTFLQNGGATPHACCNGVCSLSASRDNDLGIIQNQKVFEESRHYLSRIQVTIFSPCDYT